MSTRAGVKLTAWTDAENALMLEHYREGGAVLLAPLLPGRSQGAIHQRAKVLGLSTLPECWTAEQDELICMHLPSLGAPAVAEMVGRTAGAVRARASRLKVRAERPIQRMPQALRAPAPTVLRKAEKVKAQAPRLSGEPVITSATRVTIAPAFVDRRFAPNGPPPRVVDPDACRDWAMAAARVDGVRQRVCVRCAVIHRFEPA